MSPQQIPDNVHELYRDVFFTPSGREVLKDILNECFVFPAQVLENEEQRIMSNVGRMILAKLGVQLPSQADEYIEAIAKMAPPRPKE